MIVRFVLLATLILTFTGDPALTTPWSGRIVRENAGFVAMRDVDPSDGDED
jgi:hypothetical protein